QPKSKRPIQLNIRDKDPQKKTDSPGSANEPKLAAANTQPEPPSAGTTSGPYKKSQPQIAGNSADPKVLKQIQDQINLDSNIPIAEQIQQLTDAISDFTGKPKKEP
ncbi:MAG: hypothetical protein AAF623_16390, partial [Planctomycetota bacterium]